MYRLLASRNEVRERRAQVQRPAYVKPELLATAPNQLWSWDITKLHGPAKWTYYYLYVILDVFSRYVVGWMIAHREQKSLAVALIEATCMKQGIQPGQLTIHADRGSSMKSKPVALLMADLGVTKSHSRPHVSDDNPYSEAQFKTMKYHASFPEKFGSIQDARGFGRALRERRAELGYSTRSLALAAGVSQSYVVALEGSRSSRDVAGPRPTIDLVVRLAALLPVERAPSPIDTALDSAIITAPEARDPALLAKLDAVCARVIAVQR